MVNPPIQVYLHVVRRGDKHLAVTNTATYQSPGPNMSRLYFCIYKKKHILCICYYSFLSSILIVSFQGLAVYSASWCSCCWSSSELSQLEVDLDKHKLKVGLDKHSQEWIKEEEVDMEQKLDKN